MSSVSAKQNVYWVAAFCSIALSIWAAFKTAVINPDGICYLQSAASMDQGLTFASHLCDQAKWPFYSMLIYGVAQLTHFSYLTAAYTLNGIFSLISVLMFIAITRRLTDVPRIAWLAALVILMGHEFNSVREDIVRDHGYWAFYLVSLFYFLQYLHGKRFAGLLWCVSLFVATLFRLEGAMFFLLLPFALLFDAQRSIAARIGTFLRLYCIPVLALVLLLVWFFMHPLAHIGRLNEVIFQLSHGIGSLRISFNTAAAAMSEHVLSVYSKNDAASILFAMLISWYMLNVTQSISLIYAVLFVYAVWKNLFAIDKSSRLAIWAYVAVNVLITFVFLVENMFVTDRYLVALSLVLMLWVPFAINDLIAQWSVRRWPMIVVGFLILVFGVGGIVNFGYSKRYIRNAGDWLATNAPKNAVIYSNDYQLLYYSNHLGNDIFVKGKEFADLHEIAHDKWQQYDYLAIRINAQDMANDEAILQEIHVAPVETFKNKRNDEVLIYKVR